MKNQMNTQYSQNLNKGVTNLTIQKKNRSRRRKKNEINHRYKCGCGKTYGSNTALYIHIKTKHGGFPPPFTITPASIKFAKKQKENQQNTSIEQGKATSSLPNNNAELVEARLIQYKENHLTEILCLIAKVSINYKETRQQKIVLPVVDIGNMNETIKCVISMMPKGLKDAVGYLVRLSQSGFQAEELMQISVYLSIGKKEVIDCLVELKKLLQN